MLNDSDEFWLNDLSPQQAIYFQGRLKELIAQNRGLQQALRIIAGLSQCTDNCLSNLDVAREALDLFHNP